MRVRDHSLKVFGCMARDWEYDFGSWSCPRHHKQTRCGSVTYIMWRQSSQSLKPVFGDIWMHQNITKNLTKSSKQSKNDKASSLWISMWHGKKRTDVTALRWHLCTTPDVIMATTISTTPAESIDAT
ncbi:hypothetical protein NDU88_007199 [Pleurodeles waltl]|uniref:Uncharacterized protein n=1 Tax=Pleurodeles waltl TaxID=8319 RepID=A0AAV7QND3_PLEWA|nr:hypothetical protein NDU88_007199 [Pleurodeles waltl]